MKNLIRNPYLFLTLSLFCVAILSCENYELDSEMQEPDFRVENNAIHFRDFKAFETTISALNDLTLNEIVDWEDNVGFRNSLRRKMEELSNIVASEDALSKISEDDFIDIPDKAFATIVNAEGLYYIEGKAHIITRDFEYVVKNEVINPELIQNLKVNHELSEKNVNIEAFNIKYGEIDYASKRSNNARFQGKETRKYGPYCTTDPYDKRWTWADGSLYNGTNICWLSAHLEAWDRTYAFYASIGIRIIGRKNDGGWRNDDIRYAAISYEAETEVCFPGVCTGKAVLTVFVSGSNKKNVDKTINYAAGVGVWHVTNYIKGDFTYEDDGFPRVYRYNEIWD